MATDSLVVTPPDRKATLAASSPWLGALLNVLPGLGTGYIYQRRWRAYWLTAVLAGLWLGVDALADELGPVPGLLALAVGTAVEAFLAGRRARMN